MIVFATRLHSMRRLRLASLFLWTPNSLLLRHTGSRLGCWRSAVRHLRRELPGAYARMGGWLVVSLGLIIHRYHPRLMVQRHRLRNPLIDIFFVILSACFLFVPLSSNYFCLGFQFASLELWGGDQQEVLVEAQAHRNR